MKLVFRGEPAEFLEWRVRGEHRRPGLNYYEVRYTKDAWGTPATVELMVAIGFAGTLVTAATLPLEGGCLELTPSEMAALCLGVEA